MPTQLANLETLNIVHILEQTVRGYLCGTNSLRWCQHIFHYAHECNKKNVKNFFYRIEFQGRGTAHIHLLIWLEDISKCSYQEINAHIPNVDRELAFLVHDLQPSHKTVLSVNENPTSLSRDNQGKYQLSLHYPASAFALKLRAYITSVLSFLKCRMDVQFSDHGGMLMRYVTNYVSKFKDSQSTESLYSTRLVPAEAAYRHLRDMKPCEPEMIMTLSSVKMAWSSNSTKSYVPPIPSTAETNSMLMKYHARNDEFEVTFLEFLRTHDTSKTNCPLYKRQKYLVGVKYVSYFNPNFFFQFVLMNKPHRNLDEMKHPDHERLPDDLKYFASCLVNIPQLFNEQEMRQMLEKEGHKSYFIDNVLSYIANVKNVYELWQIEILQKNDFLPLRSERQHADLDPMQTCVVNTFKSFLRLRTQYYNFAMCCANDNLLGSQSHSSEWTKIISVTGKAGTGKTKCVHSCIEHALENDVMTLVATPTGYLASCYRAVFDDDIVANTIHSAFSIPIDGSAPQVNWALALYDLIVIDEVSMVPLSIFNHILPTVKQLPTRPIVLICGDKYQWPPITSENDSSGNRNSVYQLQSLPSISRSFNLIRQHRCVDKEYSEILDHLRSWKPTSDILEKLQHERLLHNSEIINDTDLLCIIHNNASSIFLTVSRNAALRINRLILENLFNANLLVGTVEMDNDEGPTNIFKGMRIMFTQNRDKKNGIVNGQPGIVYMMKGITVLIRLPNGKTVSVYPVSNIINMSNQEENREKHMKKCYPFTPAYAMTICKSQGQTLDDVVVWFDVNCVGQGAAYVALSCVKSLQSSKFLTPSDVSLSTCSILNMAKFPSTILLFPPRYSLDCLFVIP